MLCLSKLNIYTLFMRRSFSPSPHSNLNDKLLTVCVRSKKKDGLGSWTHSRGLNNACTYDEERQVTKPTSPLQSCRSRTEFWHSRSRSIAVTPDTMCRAFSKGVIFCIRERQLWSGNEDGEIRYVNDSSVTGTSALSPGVPRHISKLP